jgi:hypothetical protein
VCARVTEGADTLDPASSPDDYQDATKRSPLVKTQPKDQPKAIRRRLHPARNTQPSSTMITTEYPEHHDHYGNETQEF